MTTTETTTPETTHVCIGMDSERISSTPTTTTVPQ